MPSNSQTGMNGGPIKSKADKLNEELQKKKYIALFHGDNLLGDPVVPKGFLARFRNAFQDVRHIFQPNNTKAMGRVVDKLLKGQGLDKIGGAQLIGSMPNDSNARAALTAKEVKEKYEKMLHPPLTYLGDAFQYRTADGKFNSALHPHLGQAGAPYAKTVPSKTHPLGALPDPEDIFDRLMAREKYRPSQSGLSSMLVYHATIIIHDIFRTNDNDKNISDSSSYLDLSPLYGYTDKMQRRVRDDKYKLGLLKPDTFAEDRLLRQPPGVCIMLVMYNRYHNYAATQLYRINENGRFSVPAKFSGPKLIAAAEALGSKNAKFEKTLTAYRDSLKLYDENGQKPTKTNDYEGAAKALEDLIDADELRKFNKAYDAAWDKLDNDLFNTARLTDQKNVTRGLGNQVTVEFNLLYRFHCAISEADELYTEDFMKAKFGKPDWDPKTMTLEQYVQFMSYAAKEKAKQAENGDESATDPSKQVFGLPEQANKPDLCFTRNKITGLFDDQKMINQLQKSMQEPICES
ncbi:uncharacterized protein KY384_006784 [Bacidia gigantensis]|uniref:uncharacterized protein n=1 Tax=Bacidia gigantensis TaxID=2732470 RepID=UPI001D042086|nr:uncharacterized protein KY384_006784 [Bacidia gigantensis]KAG8527868.1 hypothetical protein KY384_006784 [Bacidia gigantensis]